MKSMRIFVFIKRTFKNTSVFVEFSLQHSRRYFSVLYNFSLMIQISYI